MSGAVKRKVLLVDDEPSLVKIIGKVLELAGFEVLTAIDGQQALDQVAASRPDAVILDLMLPRVNGFDVLKRMRQDPQLKDVPVLIFTARGRGTEDEELCKSLGATAFFSKTEPAQTIVACIKQLLGVS
jgi:CheY-like chemotaxis protein